MAKNFKLPENYDIKLNAMELGFVTALVYNWRIDNSLPGHPITPVYQQLYEKLTKQVEDVYAENSKHNRKV